MHIMIFIASAPRVLLLDLFHSKSLPQAWKKPFIAGNEIVLGNETVNAAFDMVYDVVSCAVKYSERQT